MKICNYGDCSCELSKRVFVLHETVVEEHGETSTTSNFCSISHLLLRVLNLFMLNIGTEAKTKAEMLLVMAKTLSAALEKDREKS
jgi:hypothetical protein